MTNAPGSPQWERNEALLKARVERELHAGRDFMQERITKAVGGVLARVVNPLARSVWDHLGEAEVLKRVMLHVDVVLDACRDAAASGDVERAVVEHAPRALETEELVHRAHRDHAAFPELEAITRRAFAERVDAVLRFLAEGVGEEYAAVTRSAFPDPVALKARVREHLAHGRDALALVRAHPGLVRFPRAFLPPVLRVAGDVTEWFEARVLADVDAIYGHA